MKFASTSIKPKTISELAGKDEKAFERFLRAKDEALRKMEQEVDARIRKSLGEKMALAA